MQMGYTSYQHVRSALDHPEAAGVLLETGGHLFTGIAGGILGRYDWKKDAGHAF